MIGVLTLNDLSFCILRPYHKKDNAFDASLPNPEASSPVSTYRMGYSTATSATDRSIAAGTDSPTYCVRHGWEQKVRSQSSDRNSRGAQLGIRSIG